MGVFTLPLQTYPVAAQDFGPISTPQGLTGCEIMIVSCTSAEPTIWPDVGSRLSISLDCSYDGGQSYQLGQFRWAQGGGILLMKDGLTERATRRIRFNANPPPSHVIWHVEVSGGAIRTQGTLTTL